MRRHKFAAIAAAAAILLTFSVLTNAQTRGRYYADIPFEFAFADDIYDAGSFEAILEIPSYDANIFTLRDEDGMTLKRTVILRSGNRSKDENVKFVFDHYDRGYVLKEIVAPGFGFKVARPSEAVWVYITENGRARSETVAVVLRRKSELAR